MPISTSQTSVLRKISQATRPTTSCRILISRIEKPRGPHGLKHERLVRPGCKLRRSGIAIDRTGSIRRRRMDREVVDVVQLVHVVEKKRLAVQQSQSARFFVEGGLGYEFEHFAMMAL